MVWTNEFPPSFDVGTPGAGHMHFGADGTQVLYGPDGVTELVRIDPATGLTVTKGSIIGSLQTAASGQRIVISSSDVDQIRLIGNDEANQDPGMLWVNGMRVTLQSPEWNALSGFNRYLGQLVVKAHDGVVPDIGAKVYAQTYNGVKLNQNTLCDETGDMRVGALSVGRGFLSSVAGAAVGPFNAVTTIQQHPGADYVGGRWYETTFGAVDVVGDAGVTAGTIFMSELVGPDGVVYGKQRCKLHEAGAVTHEGFTIARSFRMAADTTGTVIWRMLRSAGAGNITVTSNPSTLKDIGAS